MLNMEFLWETVIPALNHGFGYSLMLILPSALLGFCGGVFVGAVRIYAPAPCRRIADAYVALFRGVPLLLQLFFLYYALPQLMDIRLSPYAAAVLGFALCSAAYQSEYIRGALLSIRRGQILAAYSLGFSTWTMILTVTVPQALRRALPGCGNEIIYLIKYSSLAYLLTYIELTGTAKELTAHEFHHVLIYTAAGLYYLFMTTVASACLRRLERKLHVPGFGAQPA